MRDGLSKWLVSGVLLVVIVTNLANISKQLWNLYNIRQLVAQQKEELTKLEDRKLELEEQVEYAQTEEYKQRAYRWYLGLGTKNDYWVDVGLNKKLETAYGNKEVRIDKAKWQEWLDLIRE